MADEGDTDLNDALAQLGKGNRFEPGELETAARRMAEMQADVLDEVLDVAPLHERLAASDTDAGAGKGAHKARSG